VTHVGYLEPELYRPDSVGHPLAADGVSSGGDGGIFAASENGAGEVAPGQPGELVMRGPQFMRGYWKEPEATGLYCGDGWYWSGDIVTRDGAGFYRVVDRAQRNDQVQRIPVAPAEVEAVLLEHPAVRECGVVGRPDDAAGEIPVAFIALRDGYSTCKKMEEELCAFVGERLTHYKQRARSAFCGGRSQDGFGKNSAAGVETN